MDASLPNRIAVTPGLEDLEIAPLSRPEIIEILKGFHVGASLQNICFANLVLSRGGTDLPSYVAFLSQYFFRPEILEKLADYARSHSSFADPFHPGTFRLLAKLIWRYGDLEEGKACVDEADRHRIGDVLLSLYSAFGGPDLTDFDPRDPKRHLADAVMAELYMYSPRRSIELTMSLKEAICADILATNGVRDAYVENFGFSPEELFSAVLVLEVYFGQADTEFAKKHAALVADYKRLFAKSGIGRKVGDWLVNNFVLKLNDGPRKDSDRFAEHLDYTYLVNHPFAELIPDHLICLDWEWTEELLAWCLFKTTAIAMRGRSWNSIESMQGHAFATYCNSLISQIGRGRPAAIGAQAVGPFAAPRELDGGYFERGALVVCEFKSAPPGVSAVLGGSVDALEKDLRDKFIDGSPGTSGAMKQLADRCKRIIERPSAYEIPGHIDRVFPVLVVQDYFLALKPMVLFFQEASQSLFHDLPSMVKPPIVIHANDLRMLVARAPQVGFANALRCWHRSGFVGLNFYSWLLHAFPPSDDGPQGMFLDIEEPSPFSNSVFSELLARFKSIEEPRCPHCGAERHIWKRAEGGGDWECLKCSAGNEPATPDEVDASERHADELRAIYDAS